jgi:hypothetical protein
MSGVRDKEGMRERYRELNYQQRVMLTKYVDLEIADAILSSLRRLVKVANESRNDQAATSAARTILALAERRKVLESAPGDEFMEAVAALQQT